MAFVLQAQSNQYWLSIGESNIGLAIPALICQLVLARHLPRRRVSG